ncbi:PEP-CTERM/exosortase system-associated acyltransferase [Geomesophilobacter sediminis]|uniref:PEP-CTERM/exosortase system-associated acyltransferase n=1 Tax=Geomesophilobacter sediminis TaxID=2798584 RepID=A0A8J7INK3_9BACT|nr:PEP-CTERM/exosortase system-associated acyltransferase [Geomesophilobacter sediminis]MBJ6723664.1 PEP-CTERM/exosortase system-associated acyltransferase [Geomesophilobacter sediminis]
MSEYFDFKKVELDDPLIEEVYRLRYKVYCDEWGFERPEDHPEGVEKDEYDDYSLHYVAIAKRDAQVIGTIRLILASPYGFPIEQHCTIDVDRSHIDPGCLAEVSRLAISKDYRRRASDNLLYEGHELPDQESRRLAIERRKADNEIVLGLYMCVFRECMQRPGIHIYMAMARGLHLLLKRVGFFFDPAGPEIDYHGLRAPYLTSFQSIRDRLAEVNPEYARLCAGVTSAH